MLFDILPILIPTIAKKIFVLFLFHYKEKQMKNKNKWYKKLMVWPVNSIKTTISCLINALL